MLVQDLKIYTDLKIKFRKNSTGRCFWWVFGGEERVERLFYVPSGASCKIKCLTHVLHMVKQYLGHVKVSFQTNNAYPKRQFNNTHSNRQFKTKLQFNNHETNSTTFLYNSDFNQ